MKIEIEREMKIEREERDKERYKRLKCREGEISMYIDKDTNKER